MTEQRNRWEILAATVESVNNYLFPEHLYDADIGIYTHFMNNMNVLF